MKEEAVNAHFSTTNNSHAYTEEKSHNPFGSKKGKEKKTHKKQHTKEIQIMENYLEVEKLAKRKRSLF